MSVNISDFIFLFKNCNPLNKFSPPLSQKSSSKSWDCVKPLFFRWDSHLYMSLFHLSIHPFIYLLSVCLPCTISQEPYNIWSYFLVHMCKLMISPGVLKGQKIAQKLHLSCAKSQKQYSIIWSWFLVHLCEMMISPGIFYFFFLILIFWAAMGVKGQKNSSKWQKIMSVALHISGTMHYMTIMYDAHV